MTAAGRSLTDPADQPRAHEDPWAAVVRECREELGIEAVPSPITGELPLFLTVTRTRGEGVHTDVSLWYVLHADADTSTSYDRDEFDAIRWLTSGQVREEPDDLLDPHMHRFTHKLEHVRAASRRGWPHRGRRRAARRQGSGIRPYGVGESTGALW